MIVNRLNAAATVSPSFSLAEKLPVAPGHDNQANNTAAGPATQIPITGGIKLTLSAQAKEKAKTEQVEKEEPKDYGVRQSTATDSDEENVEQTSANTSVIDSLIADVEEQLRLLKEKIDALRNKDDEASKEQLEMLTKQMMLLNGQLLTLYKKREELIKAEK